MNSYKENKICSKKGAELHFWALLALYAKRVQDYLRKIRLLAHYIMHKILRCAAG